LNAAHLFEEGHLAREVASRYSAWDTPQGRAMLNGELSLDAIAARVEAENLNPSPRSGRQERLENLVSRYC